MFGMFSLIACGSGIEFTILGDQSFTPAATAHVTVWGYDPNIQDVPATEVGAFTFPVDALPHTETLALEPRPWTRITEYDGPVAASDASYYFSLHVDADSDGQLCAEDLDQDFGDSGSEFFQDLPSDVAIPVAPHGGTTCEPLTD